MKIRDYTAQEQAEALTQAVGRVFRLPVTAGYGMIIDCEGRYGWVDLATGQAFLPDSIGVVREITRTAEFLDATVTIGAAQ